MEHAEIDRREASRKFDVDLCYLMGWKSGAKNEPTYDCPDLNIWYTADGEFHGTPNFTSDVLDALTLVDYLAIKLRGTGTLIVHVGMDTLGFRVVVCDICIGRNARVRSINSCPGGGNPMPLAICRAVSKFGELVKQGQIPGVFLGR